MNDPAVHVCEQDTRHISIAELIAWLRQQQIPARVAHDNSTKDLQQGFYAGRFDAFESTIMHLEDNNVSA